jgi:HNH endonuclease
VSRVASQKARPRRAIGQVRADLVSCRVRVAEVEGEGRNRPAYIVTMEDIATLTSVSDDTLLRRLLELLGQSRRIEADVVAHIGEVDARRLYAREAAPSMFAYCTEVLHLSQAEAYLRITVARASREHPILLEMLADGRMHVSGIAKLASHLNVENRDAVLARAAHRSKRDIEALVAELAPRPDAPSVVRKLPQHVQLRPDGVELGALTSAVAGAHACAAPLAPPTGALTVARPIIPPTPPASTEPLAPTRYKVQFTAGAELCEKLERLRSLMRSRIPNGDLAAIIEDAVGEKLTRLEARRFARTAAPRKSLGDASTAPRSRHLPAPLRRAVYLRDGGRCAFVDEHGRRCVARDHLEYHHRRPFAHGGEHDPENVSLVCRTHNAYLADVDYGRARVRFRQRQGKGVSEAPAVHGA